MIETKTHATWFVLGQAPQVSLAEIFSVFPETQTGFTYLKNAGAFCAGVNSPQISLQQLAGTIKIGREVSPGVPIAKILEVLAGEFTGSGKAEFGISVYGSAAPHERTEIANDTGFGLKKLLVAKGLSARFVDTRGEPILSSASVVHNKLLDKGREFLLFEKDEGYAIAVTTAVQPFEQFSARDFGRPGRDDFSGMLPPKLALMMLNMATGHAVGGSDKEAITILDPFCGSGTILTEAMLLGYKNLIGCDLSDRAISDTKKNVEWTQAQLPPATQSVGPKLFVSDVRELSKKVSALSVSAIVTEPFLGPPLRGGEKSNVINKIIDELQPLYKAALQEFVKVLAPGGVVVMIIPRWYCHGEWLTLSNLLPIKNPHFDLQPVQILPKEMSKDKFVLYHRPGQFVGREIWKLMHKPL